MAIMIKSLVKASAILALAYAAPISAQEAELPPLSEQAPAPNYQTTAVVLETSMGEITIALEVERAPITAANFLAYIDQDRLDGTVFYRSMPLEWGTQPNGLIQGGTQFDPERILDPIAHERTSDTGVLHLRGAISMARYDPGTATGDFSIMLQTQSGMDADPAHLEEQYHDGYAAFGYVIKGMEVVEAIHAAPTDPEKGEGWMKGQMIADPIVILDARRVEAENSVD